MICFARILQQQCGKCLLRRHNYTKGTKFINRPAGLRKGLVVALAYLFQCGEPTVAEPFKFSPAACKHDTGNLYVALGRYVFATPSPTVAQLVIDPIPASRRLKVPDPNEPVGCLGNPLQSDSHALLHSMLVESKSRFPDLLTLYNLRRSSSAADEKDEEWMAEVSAVHIADSVCRTATLRENSANGFLGCRIKPADSPNTRQEDWAASYISQSEGYGTPLGKPFIVNCGPGLFSNGIGQCDVAYAVKPGVGVSYRFQPYRGSHPIPIEHIIVFDKSLRLEIERALVKDYRWPD